MKYSPIIETASKGYKGYAVNKGIFSPGSKCYIEVVALNGVGGNNQRRFLERNFISLLFLKRPRALRRHSLERESSLYLLYSLYLLGGLPLAFVIPSKEEIH